jgi:Na+-transporting NADH:ubiquinone oxidoreductase subunit NqrB
MPKILTLAEQRVQVVCGPDAEQVIGFASIGYLCVDVVDVQLAGHEFGVGSLKELAGELDVFLGELLGFLLVFDCFFTAPAAPVLVVDNSADVRLSDVPSVGMLVCSWVFTTFGTDGFSLHALSPL